MDDAGSREPTQALPHRDGSAGRARLSGVAGVMSARRCCCCQPCRPRRDPGPDLRVLHAGAGAMLEPAGGLCRAGLGRPAGLCRARRLSPVRADDLRRARSDARDSAGGARVAALFAMPTAFVVFRLRGAYFAIGTWVVAEVYRLVLAQIKQLGGGTGTSLPAVGHQRRARASNGSRHCSMCARRPRATS